MMMMMMMMIKMKMMTRRRRRRSIMAIRIFRKIKLMTTMRKESECGKDASSQRRVVRMQRAHPSPPLWPTDRTGATDESLTSTSDGAGVKLVSRLESA